MDETSSPDYEFGGFRLDTSLQVLISPSGETLPLASRAFATLRFLVERAGEIVDKSALMSMVWPKTIVSENNLNQCILALRKALGETAGERRFILTVTGRGYKFIAPVTVIPHERFGHAPEPPGATPVAEPPKPSRGLWLKVAAVAAMTVLSGMALWLWLGRNRPVTDPAEYEQLTDVTDGAVAPVLSPDGHMLAFIRNGASFQGHGQIWLKVLPNGEPVKLTDVVNDPIWAPAFTPDSANVLYSQIDLHQGSWDTWMVPVTGQSAPTRMLPNAQGLTYIGPRQVLYSQFKDGMRLGVVTSLDDRSAQRQVYLPTHERGMAHFSYLSPDRKSVLIAEMDHTGWFDRCRVASFDGKSPGYAVGPLFGGCVFGAWSPDGRWMYFSGLAGYNSHLWRQRFPHGEPEQITFGPGEEQGVFATLDGRSLLTSIGLTQSTLWFHNAQAERVLTTEGRVSAPWLSGDAQRVYFLTVRNEASHLSLSRMDIASGRLESLVTGFGIMEYDISPDERRVAFTIAHDGTHEIWIAALDRHTPPTLLVRGGDEPEFGGDYVFFRRVGEHASFLHRIRPDGSGESQLLPDPISEIFCAAPDGRAVVVMRPNPDHIADAWIIPVDSTGQPVIISKGYAPSQWSRDGKTLYVGLNVQEQTGHSGWMQALPVGPDDLPLGALPAQNAGAVLIPHQPPDVSIGPDPSVYVFLKSEQRQNIYRIPLH
jgi:DNA-binding winged helix-turn-helix (wHTH) protein/Tol biopolymer transport system component